MTLLHLLIFSVLWPDWSQPFLTIVLSKYLESAFNLIFVILYQHAKKKTVHIFLLFILQIQTTRLVMPIFNNVHPKNFQSTFNLCELLSTCKKSGYFVELFWRYNWLKNPTIWLGENILAHISGTKIFSNLGFVQEHSK